jgi:hypothetical protein
VLVKIIVWAAVVALGLLWLTRRQSRSKRVGR